MDMLRALVKFLAPTLLFAPPTAAQRQSIVDAGGGGQFRSIQDCLAQAGAGDFVLVRPGTYPFLIDAARRFSMGRSR
jgi:hypothetical protein